MNKPETSNNVNPILIPDEYRDESLEKPLLKEWGFKLVDDGSNRPLLKGDIDDC